MTAFIPLSPVELEAMEKARIAAKENEPALDNSDFTHGFLAARDVYLSIDDVRQGHGGAQYALEILVLLQSNEELDCLEAEFEEYGRLQALKALKQARQGAGDLV